MNQQGITKDKLLIVILSLTLCLVCLVAATYAWLSASDHVDNANLQILQIDSRIRVYEAKDVNYNGVPDLLVTDGHDADTFDNPNTLGDDGAAAIGYIAYTNMYYHENYDFVLHDERYAISADTELKEISDITLEDAVPGKVYTYKYEIVNYSETSNGLTLRFDPGTTPTDALKTIDVRVGYIGSDGVPVFTEYQSLSGYTAADGMVLTITNPTIPAHSDDINVEGEDTTLFGRYDFWLQIKIDNASTTEFETLTLPEFRIMLTVEYAD